MYESCPRRYAFRYVEHLPGHVPPGRFAFGSAIHRAFEVYIRERIRAHAEGDRDRDWRRSGGVRRGPRHAGLEPEELARLRLPRDRSSSASLQREATLGTTPVAAELGFGVDVALPAMQGSIRFVGTSTGSTARAMAARSSATTRPGGPARRPRWSRATADRVRLCGVTRCPLRPASGEPLPPASRLSLYFADDGTEVTTTRTSADLAAFEHDLVAMATQARERRFDPRPEPWRCHWCEYRESCADAVADESSSAPSSAVAGPELAARG